MPRPIILNGHTLKITRFGISLEVQGLKPHASTEGGSGSIFGLGTKIPHAARCGQKKKTKTLQTTLLEAYWIHPSFVWASLVAQIKTLPVMRETRV